MTEAMQGVAAAFEVTHPGVAVRLNLSGSNVLARQIALGAPVDVFASAGAGPMDSLETADLLAPETRQIFAANRLVLIVPPSNPSGLSGWTDLAGPKVRRLAVGAVGVPVRTYAEAALRQAGLWDRIESRLIPSENVRQVLTVVASGEVDAGIVYATDAQLAHVAVLDTVAEALHPPIRYPVAVLAAAPHPELARAFVEVLLSPAGRDTLRRHGFSVPN